VPLTCKLSLSEHVSVIVSACAPTLHALRVLRSHGMNDAALQTIYKAVVVAKLTYAASVWWGFLSADDRRRIEAVLRRGIRAGFYQPEGLPFSMKPNETERLLSSNVLQKCIK